jgi:ATP-binding cassette subfamily F protein 3
MISVSNITYFIGGRALYENASAVIKPGDRIGLIGLNGKGKSTLLKIIDGSLTPDSGSISKSKDCTIGFLNQDLLSFQSEDPILTVAMGAFKEALETHKSLEKVLHEMEHNYSDNLVEKLSALQEKFDRLDGYTMQSRAEAVLEGIGFSTADLHRPLKTFSGGWRMRVMLAKLLLEKPSLLMLDEPTNHLDLPSIEWVEEYLRNYDGAVVVVSHDRTFLNNVTNRTIEVANQQLTTYEGNYDYYLEEKELREEIQQNAFENQQQKIRQAERFIDRFRAKATKSRQVQSRIKMIERMDKVEEVVDDTAAVNFRFTMKQQSGRQIMEFENISKAYGDLKILDHTSAKIERGDKIALIGANGKGKSTMLRILYGTEPVEGERKPGYNVITGFYAQHQLESLRVDNEMLEELKQAGSGKTELELRNLLGCFLFSDEDVFKKIKVLSGGEKSRVALAKTLISEANFLLLDEPTNHLDFISENILVQALEQYQGSFVIVSHNRHFIRQVANKIWWIEDGKIREYPGTYDEYLYWKASKEAASAVQPVPEKTVVQVAEIKPKPTPVSQGNEKLKKDLNIKIRTIEEEIVKTEAGKSELETELAKPEVYANHERFLELNSKYSTITSKLEVLNKEWEGLVERLSAL